MKRFIIASLACLSLAGCQSNPAATGNSTAPAPSSLPTLSDLQSSCTHLSQIEMLVPLTGGAANTAKQVEAPFNAFCQLVNSGQVPVNADGNSINWLSVGISTLSTVAALAK